MVEEGEGELRPLSARARSRGAASLLSTTCSTPPPSPSSDRPLPPQARIRQREVHQGPPVRRIQGRRRRPLANRAWAGGDGLWRVELGRHLFPSPLGHVAPWRSKVGPAFAGSLTLAGRLPHGATVFFPAATSPPPLPPRAGANGQGSMQQLLRDAAGGTPPLPCLHPLSFPQPAMRTGDLLETV
jgi:hypothetical protein